MKKPITMPALSDTMESGRLLRWLKQDGDPVEAGDTLAEVETDKAIMEMQAFDGGYLTGPLAEEDRDYKVGETLAWIGDRREAQLTPSPETAPPGMKTPRTTVEPGQPDTNVGPLVTSAFSGRDPGRPRAGGVTAAAEDSVFRELEAGPAYTLKTPTRVHRLVAETTVRSAAVPQFRLSARLDLEPLRTIAREKAFSFTLLLARACALALQEHPSANAAWTPRGIAWRDQVDVAIAMDADYGLVTPVLRDAAGTSLEALNAQWQEIRKGVRGHHSSAADFRGGTFYLSNLGMFPEVMQFDAIVPPGASAILTVAAPDERGTCLTLSCDHRVLFGADAARFMGTLVKILGTPDQWIA